MLIVSNFQHKVVAARVRPAIHAISMPIQLIFLLLEVLLLRRPASEALKLAREE
jgi:hypothetical protein